MRAALDSAIQAGEITCGPVNPAKQAPATYRSSTEAKSAFIGKPIAGEFVRGDEKWES